MDSATSFRRSLALIWLGGVMAALLVGCGGGGGGAPLFFGRSYHFARGGQTLTLSVDAGGRFTIFASDTGVPVVGAAQANLARNGQFTAQSSDGTLLFTGTVATNGDSAVCTVRLVPQNRNLFTEKALVVTPRAATPETLRGTFSGASGANSALLTVDHTGQATLWAVVGSVSGGGLLQVSSDGSLASSDNSTAGRLTAGGSSFTLHLDRLNGASVNVDITVTRVTRARWTFMVFLNAANDLQPFGPLNVNQMEKVGSTAEVNMVVQWKQAICAGCGNPDWVGTRRYFITKDSDPSEVRSQLVEEMGPSVDMGDWRELRNFILWTQQRYPADHYAVVIWNHGAGWRPTKGSKERRPSFPRSVSIDDSTNNEIQIWELTQALDVTPRMDMVIFDASLMQMTEVAYEIRSMAQVMVGSEESPPGEGYVYDSFLRDLTGNPNMTAAQFGTQIAIRTLQDYGVSSNITQSVVDLSKMQNVADRLHAFAISLMAHRADNAAAMRAARNNAQHYAYFENKDLWDYADLIKSGTSSNDLKTAADNIKAAVEAAVIAERHGNLSARSHGLAIYVPAPSAYHTSYGNLALARVTDWDAWLQNQP